MSRDEGMQVRREVLGDEHVDRSIAGVTAYIRAFMIHAVMGA